MPQKKNRNFDNTYQITFLNFKSKEEKKFKPLEVYLKNKEDTVEKMIKRFGRKVRKSNIIRQHLEKRYYKKPSEIKHQSNRKYQFIEQKKKEEQLSLKQKARQQK